MLQFFVFFYLLHVINSDSNLAICQMGWYKDEMLFHLNFKPTSL